MNEEEWKSLVGKKVLIRAGERFNVRLGTLLGCGGAGAVFDILNWNEEEMGWVVKVLDPASPVAEQELNSIALYRAFARHSIGLLKFTSWQGILTSEDKTFPCYFMRKGKTLRQAIKDEKRGLKNSYNVIRLAAFLINGINSLKTMGFFHGDIKPDNILLTKYQNDYFPTFIDYGTLADKRLTIKTVEYVCKKSEYKTPLEEGVAYDLHCLYRALRSIYGVDDEDLNEIPPQVRNLLRCMRDPSKKAFSRLRELMKIYSAIATIPVAFYLDGVPEYNLTEHFPFEEVMKWGEYAVLRDENVDPGEPFDPLLLMKIPAGRYDIACKILASYDKIDSFVMPIARYFDDWGEEYVLIHAPDDENKCSTGTRRVFGAERIQDASGKPYTLEAKTGMDRDAVMESVKSKIHIKFAPKDVWHMDGHWKLNLFSVDAFEKEIEDFLK